MKTYSLASALIATCLMLSGCGETTSTQRAYTEARDKCRSHSESTSQRRGNTPGAEDRRRSLLVAFRDCMQGHGWAVTGPEKVAKKPQAAPVQNAAPVPVIVEPLKTPPNLQDHHTRRAAECTYARHAAEHSSNARALAKACDLECANQKRLAPDLPSPAACGG